MSLLINLMLEIAFNISDKIMQSEENHKVILLIRVVIRTEKDHEFKNI